MWKVTMLPINDSHLFTPLEKTTASLEEALAVIKEWNDTWVVLLYKFTVSPVF